MVNEKDMLSKMNHPGIVRLHFTFQDSTWLYFALELCPNGELAELIAKRGRLPLNLVQFYTGELVNVLMYLRTLGVAHRDIKPENLFISETGHLKLGDFDTAKVVLTGSANQPPEQSEQNPQRMNTFVGTAQYVSPEMLHDSAVAGFGSDLWALGCVVYQMLTGVPPFRASSEFMTFQKILATEYSFPDDVPQVGKSLVSALLTLEPQDRLGFLRIDDLRRHPLLAGVRLDSLYDEQPPLDGVLRLRKRRVRMTSEDANLLLDSSDDEALGIGSDSSDEEGEFGSQFGGVLAPQSPSLIRCATTAPAPVNISTDSSVLEPALTPTEVHAVSASAMKKAESSPALLALSVKPKRARSCSNLQIYIEETSESSPRRASSLVSDEPGSPRKALGRTLSSKPSVVVESVLGDTSPESRPAASDTHSADAASPTAAQALTAYLQRICASDEHILMSGPVLKRRFFGKNRILVVTDLPRLLVLEPKNFRTVCEIPLLSAPMAVPIVARESSPPTAGLLAPTSPMQQAAQSGLVVTFVSPHEFAIETETSVWRGDVRDGTAQAWVSLIQAMKQKALKTASTRPPRVAFRQISPAELNTREVLNRSDFGSVDVMGSMMFARGAFSSDLPTHAELEAEAEARAEAALKLVGNDPALASPEAIAAALGRQRTASGQPLSPKESYPSSDDQYKIEIDDVFSTAARRRRRENSSSCGIM